MCDYSLSMIGITLEDGLADWRTGGLAITGGLLKNQATGQWCSWGSDDGTWPSETHWWQRLDGPHDELGGGLTAAC